MQWLRLDCIHGGKQYLPSPEFDELNDALNFNTSDCNVTGACELYSTKSTGTDKKLLRQIDSDLSSKHDELVQISKALPPPESAEFIATSPNLRMFTKDSAFGPLLETTNRRAFGYLISTLNASHPHYDFSNCLRPDDFKKLKDIGQVAADFDTNLFRFRHNTLDRDIDDVEGLSGALPPTWGSRCWAVIDEEIQLSRCDIFRFSPESDPFKDDEGAVWSSHYFFFNRDQKRVVYLYARMVPVLSSQSPPLQPPGSLKRSLIGTMSGPSAHKRARFWLGDTDPSLIESIGEDDDDDDDGFCWNRAEDGHMMTEELEGYDSDEGYNDQDEDELSEGQFTRGASKPFRGVDEDMVSRMEM